MNEKFESQKERLLAIKQEISLLYQQINYLLRNEKPLELLDLDVLMNRTHTLYDMFCAINVGDEMQDEDFNFDPEAFMGLFDSATHDEPVEQPTDAPEPVEEPQLQTAPEAEPEPFDEPTEEVELEPEPEPVPEFEPEPEPVVAVEEPVIATPAATEAPAQALATEAATETADDDKPLGDEYGFFFRFEDPVQEETPLTEPELEPEPTNEGRVVHVMEAIPEEDIPERDRVSGEELVHDNPFEMPKMENEMPFAEEEMERHNSESVAGFFDQDDDSGFELSTGGETLGEKMMREDHSLAAKLQQNPVRDLKSVIGINDKFLFVNELFGGSMEKYNKSIENLNDLKTLNGAMIYLNELKIELQWNSSNEAYLKLKELVSRKFE